MMELEERARRAGKPVAPEKGAGEEKEEKEEVRDTTKAAPSTVRGPRRISTAASPRLSCLYREVSVATRCRLPGAWLWQ